MLLLLWACVVSVVLISGFGDGDLVMVSQNGKYLPRESEVLNSEHRYGTHPCTVYLLVVCTSVQQRAKPSFVHQAMFVSVQTWALWKL